MKTFLSAFIFGVFGAVAVSISSFLEWPTWVMFIAWVSYYVFGKNLISSLRAFVQIGLGIFMGVLIQLSAGILSNLIGALGFPVAVFFFIGSLAFIARIKALNNIPAWFLGLIILFGSHPALTFPSITKLFIPILAGFIFAWLNDSAIEKIHVSPANHDVKEVN